MDALAPTGIGDPTLLRLPGFWSPGVSLTHEHLWDVHTRTDDDVWAVGERSTVFHSANGGDSWVTNGTGIPSGYDLWSIDFVDLAHGWIGGLTTIARTSNGGSDWAAWAIPEEDYHYWSAAVSPTVMWAVGDTVVDSFMHGALSRYTLGETMRVESWTWSSGAAYMAISMVDANTGWAVGESGVIRKITNGSDANPSMELQFSGEGGHRLNGVHALDSKTVYAVGDSGTIIKTVNGGASWMATHWPEFGVDFLSVHCLNTSTCLVTGTKGRILITDDAGKTWVDDKSRVTRQINSANFRSTAIAYVVGIGGLALRRFGVVTSQPTVEDFTPKAGCIGATVTITGTNFTGATAVQFNGINASYVVDSATSITATVPVLATAGPIVVTSGGLVATNGRAFSVAAGNPSIKSFSPTSGAVSTLVNISGSNFVGATGVDFNGTPAAFTVNSSTSITTSVPPGVTTGPITVTTPCAAATSAETFIAPPASSVSGFWTVTPCRVFDSREAAFAPALNAGSTTSVGVGGRCFVPPTAKAVSANLTVVGAAAPGNLRVYPAGEGLPLVSAINFPAGRTRANNAVLGLGVEGAMAVFCEQGTGTTHLIVDVNGYFLE